VSKTITINDRTFEPGTSGQAFLNVYKLPTHTKIEIPVYVFNAKEEGPTVLFSSGMHGDELNGVEVVRRLIGRDDVRNPKRGCIIAIPVINIISFLYGSRELPDGRDMNRCFPGSKTGSLGSRIAHDLMQIIIPQIDFGVDFHTGGSKISNYPQIRCVFNDPKNLELGQIFSPLMVINSPFRDNTLRKEAGKLGKQILVFEGGESRRWDYHSVNEGVNGCLRLLHHFSMIDWELPPNETVFMKKTTWVRAKTSGLFHTSKNYGARVEKGEILGMLCDPYGESEQKIIAPVTGYLVGINNQPIINQGDALMHIGIEMT
jgi:predicted deacylase